MHMLMWVCEDIARQSHGSPCELFREHLPCNSNHQGRQWLVVARVLH